MERAQAAGEVGGHVILPEHRDDIVDRVCLDVAGLGTGAERVPVIFEVALFVAVAGLAGRIETGGDGRLVERDRLPGGCFGLVDFGGKAVGGQSEQNSAPGGMRRGENGRQSDFGPGGQEGGESAGDGVEGVELAREAPGGVAQGEERCPVAWCGRRRPAGLARGAGVAREGNDEIGPRLVGDLPVVECAAKRGKGAVVRIEGGRVGVQGGTQETVEGTARLGRPRRAAGAKRIRPYARPPASG